MHFIPHLTVMVLPDLVLVNMTMLQITPKLGCLGQSFCYSPVVSVIFEVRLLDIVMTTVQCVQ